MNHLLVAERDEVVTKYGAIEGGKQHLAKMEAYVGENAETLRVLLRARQGA